MNLSSSRYSCRDVTFWLFGKPVLNPLAIVYQLKLELRENCGKDNTRFNASEALTQANPIAHPKWNITTFGQGCFEVLSPAIRVENMRVFIEDRIVVDSSHINCQHRAS